MLYYIYIGSNRIIIDHLSKVTGGMFVAVSYPQNEYFGFGSSGKFINWE